MAVEEATAEDPYEVVSQEVPTVGVNLVRHAAPDWHRQAVFLDLVASESAEYCRIG